MALLRKCLCFAMAILLLAGQVMPAYAQGLQMQESEIKAGLLYNFLKYVEWPGATTGMNICLFGGDPFQGALQSMEGRTVNQQEIKIRRVDTIQEAQSCQLLFIHTDEKDRWPQLAKDLAGKSILTVSDFENFAVSGGMIEFGRKGNRVHVWMNMDAVAAARLRVQDRLLRLITVVRPTSRADKG